jgi:hypothetical protein
MRPEILYEVFGIHSNILNDPVTGQPICLPYVPEV